MKRNKGFSLIELVIALLLLSVLAVIATEKYVDLQRSARIATLQGIAGTMQSTIELVRTRARIDGLRPVSENPGGNQQAEFVIRTQAGLSEVDWRNLCPESQAELGNSLTMADYISLVDDPKLKVLISNQYTRVGYDIQGNGRATSDGCYVTYDSFGDPHCTVELITADC